MNVQKQATRKADRTAAKAAKREGKKREIAQSAIEALKTYGYAQTTLRDIAAESDMSLGMLHYYFESKEDLLIYCVRLYKEGFVAAMLRAIEDVKAPEDAPMAFCSALVDTIMAEAEMHRLWYDIRTQAMFDQTFVPVVTEIEVTMQGLLEPFAANHSDAIEVRGLYARVDGVFRFLLQDRLSTGLHGRSEMLKLFLGALRPG